MHPHMAMDIDECIESSHLKEKMTIVVPCSNSPMNVFMWSIFSILLRSKPNDLLEHFCVCISGPDKRTGNTEKQDKKQKFLEELRDIDWYHTENPKNRCQMPVTVIRVWSRVGYAEVFEMALPWIHTDSYLLMHDDVIIKDHNWTKEIREKFYSDDDVALAYCNELLGCKLDYAINRGLYLLRLPQLQTTFLACKKKWIAKSQATWTGYHVPSEQNFIQFELEEEVSDVDEFVNYYKERNLIGENEIITDEIYNFVRQEVGAWIYYKLSQLGKKFVELDPNLIIHFGYMSRNDFELSRKMENISKYKEDIDILEGEILAHPDYAPIYLKYKEEI